MTFLTLNNTPHYADTDEGKRIIRRIKDTRAMRVEAGRMKRRWLKAIEDSKK